MSYKYPVTTELLGAITKVWTLVLTDFISDIVFPVCFLPGHAYGADSGAQLFDAAYKLISQKRAELIVCNPTEGQTDGGTIEGESWPGRTVFDRLLKTAGVTEDRIDYFKDAFNAQAEAEKMINYLCGHGFKTGLLLAQPQRLARFAAALVYNIKPEMNLKIYFTWPENPNHFGPSQGSQGKNSGLQIDQIDHELHKIFTYEYGIASPLQVIDYFKNRSN